MFAFDNSWARDLPGTYLRQAPDLAPSPRFLALNRPLCAELGLDADLLAQHPEWVAGQPPAGADPLALAYAGHQFGNFSPSLGDGRAHLLGEILTPRGRLDLQTKGSGRTAFSRGGDGKAVLGPMLREYLISEAMAALGVPTTRSLAVVTTGETVLRQEGPLPGALVVRLASSHIRVGSFEFFAARGETDKLRALLDYTIARHDPDLAPGDALGLFDRVTARQVRLIAEWQGLGFVHGVMNTDNMALSGETIDYGPCAFIDAYDPEACFSSIDRQGRYRLENQPRVLAWNLARLAEALLPLLPEGEATIDALNDRLEAIAPAYETAFLQVMARKLALPAPDADLTAGFLEAIRGADWTGSLRGLARAAEDGSPGVYPGLRSWMAEWHKARRPDAAEVLPRVNPAVIPRNHLVEEALAEATRGDMAPFEALLAACRSPFEAAEERFTLPPPAGFGPHVTFCGT